MDGQPSLWEEAKQALGEALRAEILDLLHATRHLWEAVHLFQAPGSAPALKLMALWVWALLSGMREGVVNVLEAAAVEVGLARSRRQPLTKIGNASRAAIRPGCATTRTWPLATSWPPALSRGPVGR
jgi:hypothetical protein